MKKKLSGLVLGLGLVGAMGCGDDGGGSGGMTPETFNSQITSAFCSKTFDCCTAEEIAADNTFISFTTEAECNTKLGGLISAFFPTQATVDAGKVEFNAAAASAAIEEANAATCAQAFVDDDFLNDAGAKVYKGKVAEGGSCSSNVECAVAGSDCVNGKCESPAAVGTACEAFFDCDSDADDLYCGDDMKCAAKGALAADCTRDDLCLSGACLEGKCAMPGGTDAACDSGGDCASGSCSFGTSKCEAPKADGADCFTDNECASGSCVDTSGSFKCGPAVGPSCDGL